MLPACRELGIGFVAYSPLGRGFFTGRIRSKADLAEGDYRHTTPRFQADNLPKNVSLLKRLEEMAARKGCTPAQFALGWILSRGEEFVPIPGTKRRDRLEENLEALNVTFTPEDLAEVDLAFPPGAAAGMRYTEEAMRKVNL